MLRVVGPGPIGCCACLVLTLCVCLSLVLDACCPSPTLPPTDPVPRGLLTLCPVRVRQLRYLSVGFLLYPVCCPSRLSVSLTTARTCSSVSVTAAPTPCSSSSSSSSWTRPLAVTCHGMCAASTCLPTCVRPVSACLMLVEQEYASVYCDDDFTLAARFMPEPTLSPTHPVPRGLLTLCPAASSGPQGRSVGAGHRVSRR